MVTVVIAVVNTTRLNYWLMQRPVVIAMVAAFCLGLANPAYAAPKKAASHGRPTVALAPAQADGKVAKGQLESIDRSLASHAGANAEVVATKALDKRVRGTFASEVRQCKGDGGCLSKLAKAAKIDMVLAPVARPENDGTGVVVTVATATEARRVSWVFVTAADLNAAVTANAGTLFSTTAPASAASTDEPALESLAALPLEPLEPTPAPAPAPTPAPPPKPVAKPAPPPPAQIVETKPVVPAEPSPSPALGATQRMPTDSGGSTLGWKGYVGAGAAAVGIAGITYGIVQYLDHKSIVDDANKNTSLTQREAKQLDDDAQSAYDRSRLGLYVGIPLVAIGAALLTWDLTLDGDGGKNAALTDRHLKLSVVPDARGGAAGAMAFSW